MQRPRITLILVIAGSLNAGCTTQKTPAPPQPKYESVGTIKELMDSMVDPNADAIWGSIEETVSATKDTKRFPHTEDEWKDVRYHALALIETTNLLLMPGRHVARPGEKA